MSPLVISIDHPDRTAKPFSRAEEPTTKSANENDTDSHGSVVECLVGDGIQGGQAEDDGDEANPQACDRADDAGEASEVEGAFVELRGIENGDQDGEAVGGVEADGGNGRCGGKGDGRAEGGSGEEEGEGRCQPDYITKE